MLALRGTYQNGNVELEKKVESTKKMEVIVTFWKILLKNEVNNSF